MLVPETSCLKSVLIFRFVDFLKDVLEATVVPLQDCVFGRQVARIIPAQGVLHARTSKAIDRFISVVHSHHDAWAREVVHIELGGLRAVLGCEGHSEFTGRLWAEVSRPVLITKGVSAYYDGFGPAWHEARDVFNDDWLSKDCATDDVSDGAVGRPPHLLEVELSDASLVRRNRRALNANFAGLDGLRSVNGDLIVSGVTVLNAEIEVLDVKVQVRVN